MFEYIDDFCVDMAGKNDEGLEYQLKSINDLKELKSGRETI